MGGVAAVVIVEDNVLLLFAALDDFLGTGLELIPDLVNQWHDELSNDGKDKNGQLLFQLLEDLGENRNFLNGRGNLLHDIVVILDDRHDLSKELFDVSRELFGISRRNGHVLHVRGIGIVLDLIDLLGLLLVIENPIRDLVKQIPEHACVAVLALLEGAFELINFILGQFVGDWQKISSKIGARRLR